MKVINFAEKFNLIQEFWNPKIAGELNGQQVKLAKVKGEFVWHDHKNEDELFIVLKGELNIEFHDQTVTIREGEMIIVPKGVKHRPFAKEEVHLLLFEPASTKHTGDVKSPLTVDKFDFI